MKVSRIPILVEGDVATFLISNRKGETFRCLFDTSSIGEAVGALKRFDQAHGIENLQRDAYAITPTSNDIAA